MVPNYFKKGVVQTPGCIYFNGLTVAVETGWSAFTADYGDTATTGFYPGPIYLTGQNSIFDTNTDAFSAGKSQLVIFTGSTPSFMTLSSSTDNSATIQWLSGASSPPNASTGILQASVTIQTAILSSGLNNTGCFNYYISDMPTSGLTIGIIPTLQPMRASVDYNEFSFNRSPFSAALLGRPAGQGRVRGYNGWAMNGLAGNVVVSGNTSDFSNNFTFCLYSAVNGTYGPNQYIITSGTGATKNFAIKYWNATATTVSMVIETPSSVYSAATTGTRYNGFTTGVSSGFPTTHSNNRLTSIVKDGSNIKLYWYDGFGTYSAQTLMWEVTVNDWSVPAPSIPVYFYNNPILNIFTPGGIQSIVFYNRALTGYELNNVASNVLVWRNGISY